MAQQQNANVVLHEKEHWDNIFAKEIESIDQKDIFSSLWWKKYYTQLAKIGDHILSSINGRSVLEAGSGSGKGTMLLSQCPLTRHLLDISPKALKYSELLQQKINPGLNIERTVGDMFNMPYANNQYCMTWNIGTLEHYDRHEIIKLAAEMMRVTKQGGVVCIGMPRFFSGPTLLAWLRKKIPIIPGYKLDTEKFHKSSFYKDCFYAAAKQQNRTIKMTKQTIGNPLPMETPAIILNTLGSLLYYCLPQMRFLMFLTFKLDEE